MGDEVTKGADHEDEKRKQSVQLSVPTCVQMYSWDCGLACVSMVLRYFGKDDQNVYSSDLEELKCGESTWSIDIAMMLRRHELKIGLTTIVIGANVNHAKKAFYLRHFDKDEQRVNKAFAEASSNGITVQERSVSMDEIIDNIIAGNLMVCLIDWTYLECIWCDRLRRNCFSCFKKCCNSYQGHFVVVCGYDLKKKRIFYKNPSYEDEMCCSSMEKFDEARQSSGTDEDIIFISREEKSESAGT